MPKRKQKITPADQKNEVHLVDETQVISCFGKMKPAESTKLICIKNQSGGIELWAKQHSGGSSIR